MKISLFALGAVGALIVYATVSHFWHLSSRLAFDDAAQQKAPFDYVDLGYGPLHYRWQGPEAGPVVVMVHGFSTPLFIFDQNAEALAAAGFRVLRFDHYGRGWSARPDAAYDADFYDNTLIQLLDALDLNQPISLAGLSMGGIIATEFTARHPERVKQLVLFVPAGLDLITPKAMAMIMRLPLVRSFFWHRYATQRFSAAYDEHMAALPPENRLRGNVAEQFAYAGTAEALLKTLDHLPMAGRDDSYKRLALTNTPTLAIFGESDDTVAISSADRLAGLMPNAEIMRVENGGHGLNFERHQEINPVLVNWLQANH
jgi:pimeloyl-ACP methyl ester carboxylesterase